MRSISRASLSLFPVGIALVLSLYLQRTFHRPTICTFFLAVISSTWYLGRAAGVVAVMSSLLAVDYFVVEPGSFALSWEEIPRFVCFGATAALVAIFAATRRRAEEAHREVVELLEAEIDGKSGELEEVIEEKKRREESSTKHRKMAEHMKARLEAIEAEAGEARRRVETLTAREREVFGLLIDGLLNKQIAARLGIAEITVKVHRKNTMRKMGASSFAELVRSGERLRAVPEGQ